MRETITTVAAAERAEAGLYAEADISYAEDSSTVRSIGVSLPVSDEQLEDVPGVQGMIDGRLLFFLRQRLDGQVLTGTGAAPLLRGILNVVGVQTQAKGADPTFDAIHKAITLVQVTGRSVPSAIILHPNDWQDIRLTRTADGIYILGNPADVGAQRLWGLPAVVTDAETEGTGLVGDFVNHCELRPRSGAQVQVGLDADDFTHGLQTIRAGLRTAFVVYRPTAFCMITGV
jgi:HK97 family phage major capsid protein